MSEFIDLLLPWWWGETDKIMDGFISVILLTFIILSIILMRKTFRRASRIDSLSKEVDKYKRPAQPSFKHNLKASFERNNLAEAWQEFEDSLIEHPREDPEVVYKTDDSSLFFGEDRLLDQQLNLRFWNSVPALLVGLGILGTFVGLVWGLRPFAGIDFTEIEKIGDAIKTLLSGVSTAFVTSVWGMSVSLVFNLFEKWRMGRISQAITNLQRALDKLFTLTTQEAISFRQEDELAQQTAALRSFSTDLANEIKSAMTQGRQEIIQELHNAPEAFSSAMAEQLTPSLDSLNTAVEELRRQREESSIDAIQRLVEEFHESLSGSTTAQLEELAETVRSASAGLAALPEQLTDMITSVQDQIDQSRQLLSATSEEQTGQLQGLMDGMFNAFQRAVDLQQSNLSEATNQSIQALQSTITQLQESITSTASQNAKESEAMTTRMRELLESSANQTGEQLNRRMADIEAVSSQSIQALQSTISQLQESITSTASQNAKESEAMTTRMRELLESSANQTGEQLNRRMTDIEAVSSQSIQVLQSTIAQLQESITSTASQNTTESEAMIIRMRELLESSANQIGEQLNRRMADIDAVSSQSIQALQSTIAQLQESITSTASQNTTESEAMIIRMRELLESAANQTGEQLNRRMVDMEAVSNQSIQMLEAAITELQQALTSTLDTQQQAIGNITSQTSTAFTESSDRMRQLVDQSVERLERVIQAGEQSVSALLNQQGAQIRAINAQIANSQETLARGRNMLEQMNTTVTSVSQMIETTQTLSSQLMLGADRLETAGRQLTLASSAFNQENENYLSANRETTRQLQGTLVQSRELLNDFAQRFQTIDARLNSIFAEIQRGLDAYSSVSHETITSYLGDFSSLVTNAVNSLAVSIEALRGLVEELSDSIERFSRR